MSASGEELTCEDLKKVLANGKVTIIDVRKPAELEKGKIEGSINIPVDNVKEAFSLNPGDFEGRFGFEKPALMAPLIFHCQMGRRGANATAIARQLGYTRAQNLKGGFGEWVQEEQQ
ncbi:thiosulfate:glutathione sulfurtransferase-like isoform X2 [Scyliorhinus canicula]|uniref:thiosulfate:glutathione sulfurtransferase-like isoform X2 n=1 Tax=Scyliorhinus canicula TaxID=7830 RepID=UPI0018F6639C|nr:thiosulfate:glutathione sulfurtransferase-like isoform X2 [Scyliorhinus canicula]